MLRLLSHKYDRPARERAASTNTMFVEVGAPEAED